MKAAWKAGRYPLKILTPPDRCPSGMFAKGAKIVEIPIILAMTRKNLLEDAVFP